jgi:hypothetical protein
MAGAWRDHLNPAMTAHLSADEPGGNVQGTGFPAVADGRSKTEEIVMASLNQGGAGARSASPGQEVTA